MDKKIIISIIVSILLIGAALFLGSSDDVNIDAGDSKNVYMENGKQVIEITAKGGYYPRVSVAKKGLPTMIRLKTDNAYDCSSSVSIPKIGFRKLLAPTGVEDIPVTEQEADGVLNGLCSMGMYNFKINFE